MSTLDSAVLDYISGVKANWPEWSVGHGNMFGEGVMCQICKGKIEDSERYAVLIERRNMRGYYHESCLEQSIKENPDLKGTIRL